MQSDTFTRTINSTISENASGFKIVEVWKYWKDETLTPGAAISTVITYPDQAAVHNSLPDYGSDHPRPYKGNTAKLTALTGGHIDGQPNLLKFTLTYEYKNPGAITYDPKRKGTNKVRSLSMEPLSEAATQNYQTPNGEPIPVDLQRYAVVFTDTWDDTTYNPADYDKTGKVDGANPAHLYRDFNANPQEDEDGVFYRMSQSFVLHPDGTWDRVFKVKGHVIKDANGKLVTKETPVYIKPDGTQGADDGSDAATITVEYPKF